MTARATARLAIGGFALVALAGVLLRPAAPIDETRYLAVAWEMWLSGDLLVPTKNFAIYAHKPPLLFWSINGVWALFGVSDVAARLVGPTFALLTVLLASRLARSLWPEDEEIGARAMIALSGSLAFAFFGGLTMFDAALSAAAVGSMLALVRAARTRRPRDWVLVGLGLAMGVLAKGPVILIHVLPAMLFLRVWAAPNARPPLREVLRGSGLALLVALATVGLWLVPAIVAGGAEYRAAVLWTQSAGRVASSFAHARPWWAYAPFLPVLLFPWVLSPGLWRAGIRTTLRAEPGLRLAAIWAGGALVLFSLISGKQMHYLLPELVPAALVVARLSRSATVSIWPAAAVAMLLAVVAGAAGAGLVPLGAAAELLTPRPAVLAFALLVVSAAFVAVRAGGLRGGAILSLGMLAAANLLVGVTASRNVYDARPIAAAIVPHAAEGIAVYGAPYHAEFNFAGRFEQPVAELTDPAALADWQAVHPRGVIVARADRDGPAWPSRATFLFRNRPYAIWHVADSEAERPRT